MTAFVVLVLLGLGSYLFRASFIVVGVDRFPSRVRAALDHLAPAVLAGLVATAVAGHLDAGPAYLVGLAGAAVVAQVRGGIGPTVVGGALAAAVATLLVG